jgi:hypothetical protein
MAYEKRWCRTYINHAFDTDVSPDVIMALRRATHARTSLCRSCLESPTQGCEADADMLLATPFRMALQLVPLGRLCFPHCRVC